MNRPVGTAAGTAENPLGTDGGRRPALHTSIAVGFGLLALVQVIATRLSWVGIPLQTDTGIWAYIGGRILDGALPYRDLWESKPPGIFYLFALVERLFGIGRDGPLLWLDAVVSGAVFAVTYLVARRFASRVAAAAGVFLLSFVFCHRVLADWGDNVEKFVALFEMIACYTLVRRPLEEAGRRTWWVVGVYCGLAALFKQTGILFLLAAILATLWSGMRRRQSARQVLVSLAGLVAGVATIWVPVVLLMAAGGMLRGFWQQAVLYDLTRVSSGEIERSRLADAVHWSEVAGTLASATILFGPAVIGLLYRIRRQIGRRVIPPSGAESVAPAATNYGQTSCAPSLSPACPPLLIGLYFLLTTAVIVAPYAYGHYLLHAAPPAALLVAWLLDQTLRVRRERVWATATMVLVVLGLWPLEDHLRFTFGQAPKIRESYAMQARQVGDFVAVIQRHTRPGQSVMVWPTDCAPGAYGVPVYGALYYARRATPLEMSNSDVIFKRKINRLSPPMPELLTRLRAHAPDVIIDWSPVAVELAPPDHPEAGPQLLPTVAGFSLLEEPNEQHAFLEGRTLAPLKQWLRANYGGQELDNGCVVFYRGRPWRQWQEFILPK